MTPEERPPEVGPWPPHAPEHMGTYTHMQMYTRTVRELMHTSWSHGTMLQRTFPEGRKGWRQIALKDSHQGTEKQDGKDMKLPGPEGTGFNGNTANSVLDTDPLKVKLLRRKLAMISWGLAN